MVSSLDGYIAKKDNSVSWFETSDNYENGLSFSEQDQEAFDKVSDANGDIVTFLESKIPNLQIMVAEVVAAFKGEMLELQGMVNKYRMDK